jgi:hypothetical protein
VHCSIIWGALLRRKIVQAKFLEIYARNGLSATVHKVSCPESGQIRLKLEAGQDPAKIEGAAKGGSFLTFV